ncbi:MAG: rRNA pseudouridine synthase [Myxococcales bacterium]|nr:rRNA pseudouridine synthase [Myxococcales bacterium]
MSDRKPSPPSSGEPRRGERIAKVLARAGVASRRDVERLIAAGRVAHEGIVLTSPAVLVEDVTGITVDGQPVTAREPTRLWRYHKPFGLVTTHSDPQGRPTVFERLPAGLPRVISVGRLDQNTEGLLLLTNDGELARGLELPSSGWKRRYRVRVMGHVDPFALVALEAGLTLEGVSYGPVAARIEPTPTREGQWLTIEIGEGKNREVRNILRHLGLSVLQLVREAFGPFVLGDLPVGRAEEVPPRDLDVLLRTRSA